MYQTLYLMSSVFVEGGKWTDKKKSAVDRFLCGGCSGRIMVEKLKQKTENDVGFSAMTATIIFAKHAHVENILSNFLLCSLQPMPDDCMRLQMSEGSKQTNKMEKIYCLPRDADAEN